MNVVATRETRRIVDKMLRVAHEEGAGEAVLRHLADLDPAQIPALIAAVLNAPARCSRTHSERQSIRREPLPFTLTAEAQLRGYSQYRQGVRTDFAVTAMREYTRANKRAERERRRVS